jgi:hypothetical protein
VSFKIVPAVKGIKSDNFSTSAIAQYAITKLPVKFLSITHCDRKNDNQCNDEYSNDIYRYVFRTLLQFKNSLNMCKMSHAKFFLHLLTFQMPIKP